VQEEVYFFAGKVSLLPDYASILHQSSNKSHSFKNIKRTQNKEKHTNGHHLTKINHQKCHKQNINFSFYHRHMPILL